MCGLSGSELVLIFIVALVAIGPKDMPKVLRRLGRLAGQLRRMAADLRAQSGIDDALRAEGLSDDINEIRKLARGEIDAVQRAARVDPVDLSLRSEPAPIPRDDPADFYVARDREYPRDGADAYSALPDNAIVYAETLPRSAHAREPLYVVGDPDAALPPEPTAPDSDARDGNDATPGNESAATSDATDATERTDPETAARSAEAGS